MKSFNRSGIYLAVMSAMLPGAALAADATDVGTISVKGQSLGGGMMVQDDSAKARSTVTKEAMDKMPSAANAIDKLKYTPGLNVNSNDASGLSGVDYTMRGMNSDQIGLSMDGIPINDSGNYAVYPNLLGDAENLEEVFVTQGSSEADGPHIGSSGGNIGLATRRPAKDFGGFLKQTLGSNNLSKTFARLETGEYNGFSNWISYSHTEAKKWRGEGRLYSDKFEMNSLYEDGNGNSSNLVMKYNRQNNTNYNTLSKAQFQRWAWYRLRHHAGVQQQRAVEQILQDRTQPVRELHAIVHPETAAARRPVADPAAVLLLGQRRQFQRPDGLGIVQHVGQGRAV